MSVADDGDLLRGDAHLHGRPPAPTHPWADAAPGGHHDHDDLRVPTVACADPRAIHRRIQRRRPRRHRVPAARTAPASQLRDVILPIVVALPVIGAGAAYLLGRRNRPTVRR